MLQRRARLLKRIPPLDDVLRGSIVERSIRCGRKGCHCAQGPGHPATYLSVTMAGGKTKQISLPGPVIASARQGVATYHTWWEIMDEISTINHELLRLERDQMRTQGRRGSRGGGDGGSGSRVTRRRRGRTR